MSKSDFLQTVAWFWSSRHRSCIRHHMSQTGWWRWQVPLPTPTVLVRRSLQRLPFVSSSVLAESLTLIHVHSCFLPGFGAEQAKLVRSWAGEPKPSSLNQKLIGSTYKSKSWVQHPSRCVHFRRQKYEWRTSQLGKYMCAWTQWMKKILQHNTHNEEFSSKIDADLRFQTANQTMHIGILIVDWRTWKANKVISSCQSPPFKRSKKTVMFLVRVSRLFPGRCPDPLTPDLLASFYPTSKMWPLDPGCAILHLLRGLCLNVYS